jgi:hypothetical protein
MMDFHEFREHLTEVYRPTPKFKHSLVQKAMKIARDKRYRDNYTGAAAAINKLADGLAEEPEVARALRIANESYLEDKNNG